jgi:hypothetical protein
MGIWGAVGKVEGKVIAGVDRGDHEWLSQSRLAALKASALILDGERLPEAPARVRLNGADSLETSGLRDQGNLKSSPQSGRSQW